MATLLSEHAETLPIHRRILWFAWLGWIFDFYDLYLLSVLITTTPLGAELGFDSSAQAWLLGTSLGASAIGGLLCGWLADRYGRKPILMMTIVVYSAGTCASGLAFDATTLVIARAFTGLGIGGEWAVAHALVGETVPSHLRGRYGGYLQSGAPVGLALATFVGNFVAPELGWRWTFILSALPALLVLAMRRGLPESDLWQTRGKDRAPRFADLVVLVRPQLRRVTLIALAMTVCAMAGYWIKTIRLPAYFQDFRGFSVTDSATLQWVGHIGSFIGYISFGYFADRWGRRPTFCGFALVKALALVVVTLGWSVCEGNWSALCGVLFVMGLGEGNWSAIGPLLSELFPTTVRAGALGLIYNLSRGTQLFAPVMIVAVAEHYSLAHGIAIGAAFTAVSALLVWGLPETRGKVLAT
jgi:MFS family permease